MKYLHTMVRIRDLDESLDFYSNKLGLEELYRYESEAGRFTNIFLKAPGDDVQAPAERKQGMNYGLAPLVELTYNWPDEDGTAEEYTGGRNFGHLAYSVENIYETCQSLIDKGITINRPPRDGRMAFIKSPDGISIELLQQGKALEKEEPWASMENIGSW
jgi:lactoylglutathione lyase